MFLVDDLSVKECGECGVLLGQPFDLEVAAQEGILKVNVLLKREGENKTWFRS